MPIIPQSLSDRIAKDPENEYPVLITLKNETLPQRLKGKGNFLMDNKIFSATISGKEIQNLKNEAEIEAIEPDEEMGIL